MKKQHKGARNTMYYLKNDYSEGCHPQLLEALTRTNSEATVGYG